MSFAYELSLRTATFIADCDLSAYQYRAVKMNSDEEVVLASDVTNKPIGVLQDTPAAAGRGALVAFGGITKAIGAGVIAAGAAVEVASGGKFQTLTNGPRVGTAVNACGADNEQFSFLFDTGE